MFSDLELTGRSRSHVVQYEQPRYAATAATAAAFMAMRAAAKADGIDLVPYASFRDFNAQLRIWNKKFGGKKILFDHEERGRDFAALSPQELVWAILNWHSLPGASRRHWGTDIDVVDQAVMPEGYKPSLLPSEAAEGGLFHPLHRWLDIHMASFGFFRPYQETAGGMFPEPWHLSFAPESAGLERRLEPAILRDALADADMLGKDVVMDMLPQIIERHVWNVAQPDATLAALR